MSSTAIILSLMVLGSVGWFLRTLHSRWLLLRAAKPADRFDQMPVRLKNVLVYALGQKKFLQGEQPAGLMHAVIFWGFVIISLETVTLFGQGFDPRFHVPGFTFDLLGGPYLFLKDLVVTCVFGAVSVALYRWTVSHPERLIGFAPAEARDRKSTRLNSSHIQKSRMPSSA